MGPHPIPNPEAAWKSLNARRSPQESFRALLLSLPTMAPSAALTTTAALQAGSGLYNNPIYAAAPRPLPDSITLGNQKVSVRNAARVYKNLSEAQIRDYNRNLEEIRVAAAARWSSKAVQDRVDLTAGRWFWQLEEWIPKVDPNFVGPIAKNDIWRADVLGKYAHHYLVICVSTSFALTSNRAHSMTTPFRSTFSRRTLATTSHLGRYTSGSTRT